VLERGVVLEDEADAALLWHDAGHVFVPDHDATRIGRLESGDDAQQRRLAAAARPEQRRERAVRDLDPDIVECREVTEALGDVLSLDGHEASWRECAGLNRVRAISTMTAIEASKSEVAYAPVWSKLSQSRWTMSVSVSV
jgi:hypothetical protein